MPKIELVLSKSLEDHYDPFTENELLKLSYTHTHTHTHAHTHTHTHTHTCTHSRTHTLTHYSLTHTHPIEISRTRHRPECNLTPSLIFA